MKKRDIPKDILERVDNELLADERLLWVGLPGKGAMAADVAMKATMVGLLGLMMLGILFFVVVSQGSVISWTVTAILPAILLIAGLAVFVARLQQNMTKAELYAITNRRAMIIRKKRVQSFGSEDLRFIERKMKRDGTGDIIFNREYYQRMTIAGMTPIQTRESLAIGFMGIENPVEVEALMLETFRSDEFDNRRLMDSERGDLDIDYQSDFRQVGQS